MKLFTIGYERFKSPGLERLVRELKRPEANVNLVIDTRHSPCSSNPKPHLQYGPKDWTLQDGDKGIAHHLGLAGIEYRWMVELGNPQKNDPEMTILRAHIASADERWPVNRGLKTLADFVREERNRCCLLCVCEDFHSCHRKAIAEALNERFFGGSLAVHNLP